MHFLTKAVITAGLAIPLVACLETSSSAGHSALSSRSSSPTHAIGSAEQGLAGLRSSVRVSFDPENQVIPFPNNLMFEAGAASAADFDGTLNVPGADGTDSTANIARALGDLDGFSTVESWRLGFTGAIDPSTLVMGDTVRVFELAEVADGYPARIKSNKVERELSADDMQIRYEEDSTKPSYVMYLSPKKPLNYNRTYSVIVTYGIKDKNGLLIDAPLAAAVSRGTTKLGLNAQGQPTRCHQFFKEKDFADPEQERSLTLLQCMTFYGYNPVVSNSEFGLSKDDIMINWAITTQRKDEPFERLVTSAINGQIAPEIPSTNVNGESLKCNKAICFLDVGTMKDKPTPLTPGGNAVVFPGTIRLPVMTKGMRATLTDVYNLDFYTGNNNALMTRERAQQLTSGTWSCGEKGLDKDIKSCNSDQARNGAAVPQIEGWVTHPVVLALPLKTFKETGKKFPLVIFQHAIQQDRTNALAFADTLAAQGFAVIGIDMPLHGMEKRFLDMSNPKDASRSALYLPEINYNFQNSGSSGVYPAREFMPYALERTYYMDLVHDNASTDDAGNTLSDGKIDPSGAHFLNPALPLAQRDILRQASVDLAILSHYLRNNNYVQCGMTGTVWLQDDYGWYSSSVGCSNSGDLINRKKDKEKQSVNAEKYLIDAIDFTNLHFVGHSVGNIVATPFLAMDKNIRSVTMLAPAGVLLRTLEGSEVIGQKLSEGLTAKGVLKGTENYYRFFASVQAAIDPAEPFNHLEGLKTRYKTGTTELEPRPLKLAIIKGSEINSQDKVLPWTISGSAMAGSEHLVRLLGIKTSAQRVAEQSVETHGDLITLLNKDSSNQVQTLQTAVLLNRGDHASFLLPKNEVFAKAKKEAEATSILVDEQISTAEAKGRSLEGRIMALEKDANADAAELKKAREDLEKNKNTLVSLRDKKAKLVIPTNENDIFKDADTHAEMQRQVGSFLKEQGQKVKEIHKDFLAL